jgi:hypothetical protein
MKSFLPVPFSPFVQQWDTQIATEPLRIRKQKELAVNVGERRSVALCVNGRVGRRTACVLAGDGMVLETLDMEGEGEGDEEEEELGGGGGSV